MAAHQNAQRGFIAARDPVDQDIVRRVEIINVPGANGRGIAGRRVKAGDAHETLLRGMALLIDAHGKERCDWSHRIALRAGRRGAAPRRAAGLISGLERTAQCRSACGKTKKRRELSSRPQIKTRWRVSHRASPGKLNSLDAGCGRSMTDDDRRTTRRIIGAAPLAGSILDPRLA